MLKGDFMDDNIFIEGLETNNINLVRLASKSDLHNHADLGGNFDCFVKYIGKEIPRPAEQFPTFGDFQNYIDSHLDCHFSTYDGRNIAKRCNIEQAKYDGVDVLEISIHNGFDYIYKNRENDFIEYMSQTISEIHPNLLYIPSLGFSRHEYNDELESKIKDNIDTGYFKSIDLYGDENNDDPVKYQNIFRYAKSKKLRLKAHVGEYGNAESIRKTVELLELDEVQHGITATTSKDIMRWLSDNKIILNICPTSNIKLKVIESYKNYPINILFNEGVEITINTDDYLIFNSSISEEYLKLYNAGVLSAKSLNKIRHNGLRMKKI